MTAFDFSPTYCKKCGFLIWSGVASFGIPIQLDTQLLTIIEEIKTLVQGVRTYQIHKTSVSFEATPRTAIRMNVQDPKVLATHTCKSEGFLFGEEPPDYFNTKKLSTTVDTDEVPF